MSKPPRVHERWAHLRFSVIGQLLAAPPDTGELRAAIEALAARTWQHPSSGEPVRFGFSTIERWYYPRICSCVRARRLRIVHFPRHDTLFVAADLSPAG